MTAFPNFSLKFISIFLLFISESFATTLQFDEAAQQNQLTYAWTSYSETGYIIASGGSPFTVFVPSNNPSATQYGPATDNTFLAFCSCYTGLTLSQADNEAFNLESFSSGVGMGSSGTLYLSGEKADNSFFNYYLTIDDNQWHTFFSTEENDLSNLKYVSITGSGLAFSYAIDNINVSEVPAPATVWLFASSLLGLASVYKKNRSL